MARTVGSDGSVTIEAIRKAGLRLIYKHGYEAMSLRQLASEVGIVQGGLYNHIETKQQLLFDLIRDHMTKVLREVDLAVGRDAAPLEQLISFVRFHVYYHIDKKMEVFISYSELRSLEPGNFKTIVAMRRIYEQKLVEVIKAGAAEGIFDVSDAKTAAFGILSMLSGICTWYDPKGALSRQAVAEIFVEMVLGAVNSGAASVQVNKRRVRQPASKRPVA